MPVWFNQMWRKTKQKTAKILCQILLCHEKDFGKKYQCGTCCRLRHKIHPTRISIMLVEKIASIYIVYIPQCWFGCGIRCHSTTKWTKFYPILTCSPLEATIVDNFWHFTWYLPFVIRPSVDFILTKLPAFQPTVLRWIWHRPRPCIIIWRQIKQWNRHRTIHFYSMCSLLA